MAGARMCAVCGEVEPKGGLRLGGGEDSTAYEWYCKRVVDCVSRCAEIVKGTRPEPEESGA